MNLPSTVFALIVAALLGWWTRGRFSSRVRDAAEDPEVMKTRVHLAVQLHAAYGRRRAELLGVLVEPILVETEEMFYADSLVWRRQYEANPTAENKSKCDFHLDNLRKLHSGWELNHPGLKELIEQIGNIREALFVVAYGTSNGVQRLIADAKAHGRGST